jgi:hypothetical protein
VSRYETPPPSCVAPVREEGEAIPSLRTIMEKLDVYKLFGVSTEDLPFSLDDTTAGSETELQAVVIGKKEDVDLPITIASSHYFANIVRRTATGELPTRAMTGLERYLDENSEDVWENSWVRIPRSLLGAFARQVLQEDLLADKSDPSQGCRTDITKFLFRQINTEYIRIPISYLLKLSLAEAIDGQPPAIAETGRTLMGHFLSDNTSPETYSFHVANLSPQNRHGQGGGQGDGEAVSLDTASGHVRQPSFRSGGERPEGDGLLLASPADPAEAAQYLHLRFLLSGAFHEPLPVGVESRRGKA